MRDQDIRRIEIDVLLETIFLRYGYDFRSYARASLTRRLRDAVAARHLNSISEMVPKVLYDPQFFSDLVSQIVVNTTEMFREPSFFAALREQVVPILHTYPFPRIWHPGCSTGEEVYSMAILLHEEKLLDRCVIYATDLDGAALAYARNGIYPASRMASYTASYNSAGCKASLSDYYYAQYGSARMADFLREKITFANHNLVTDTAFGEMNIVICRNVLIYFARPLQERVLELFVSSLVPRGLLCLGAKESLATTSVAARFEALNRDERIFRLLAQSTEDTPR